MSVASFANIFPHSEGCLFTLLMVSLAVPKLWLNIDRKSTRLNSSHTVISYAVFCLKKKIKEEMISKRYDKLRDYFLFKKKRRGFPGGVVVKHLPANAGDKGPSPGPGGSH